MVRTEQYCPVGDHTKCFLNTETVLSLHQHFASGCIASGEYFLFSMKLQCFDCHRSVWSSLCGH